MITLVILLKIWKVMIKIAKHPSFKKDYKKLNNKQKKLFYDRLQLFCKEPRSPLLYLHRLTGDLRKLHSFSVGGDLRVHFEWLTKDKIILQSIGTHSQLYG